MKPRTITIIIVVLVLLVLGWMWMGRGSGGWSGDSNAAIVTAMPISGYGLDEDGYGVDGMPAGLPSELPMVPTMAAADEPDVITSAAPEPSEDPIAMGGTTEGFQAFAPAKYRGNIL